VGNYQALRGNHTELQKCYKNASTNSSPALHYLMGKAMPYIKEFPMQVSLAAELERLHQQRENSN
jgi:hypothetical protein